LLTIKELTMNIKHNLKSDTFYITFEDVSSSDPIYATISKDGLHFANFHISSDEIKEISKFIKNSDNCKICESCNHKFVSSKSYQKFCSTSCRVKSHRNKSICNDK
jgi:DNA polymerase III sliding clamp (beta) subunit (PCNA family)